MTQHSESVTLFGTTDRQGRIYLVDERTLLPGDAADIQEFAVSLDRLEWTILAVQLEEIRGSAVMIQVGQYRYVTEQSPAVAEL